MLSLVGETEGRRTRTDARNAMPGNVRVPGKTRQKTGSECVSWGAFQSEGGSGQASLRRGDATHSKEAGVSGEESRRREKLVCARGRWPVGEQQGQVEQSR